MTSSTVLPFVNYDSRTYLYDDFNSDGSPKDVQVNMWVDGTDKDGNPFSKQFTTTVSLFDPFIGEMPS